MAVGEEGFSNGDYKPESVGGLIKELLGSLVEASGVQKNYAKA